jgi:cytochrome c-type biogenesis protein CcmH
VLLARGLMDADQFAPAAAAYARAIALSRKVATDPQVLAEYADALGMTQGGRLAGKPREVIDKALQLDPRHPKALELAGSAALEARDFRAAHAHWRDLLESLPPDSPQRLPLAAAVEKVERLAPLSLSSSRGN